MYRFILAFFCRFNVLVWISAFGLTFGTSYSLSGQEISPPLTRVHLKVNAPLAQKAWVTISSRKKVTALDTLSGRFDHEDDSNYKIVLKQVEEGQFTLDFQYAPGDTLLWSLWTDVRIDAYRYDQPAWIVDEGVDSLEVTQIIDPILLLKTVKYYFVMPYIWEWILLVSSAILVTLIWLFLLIRRKGRRADSVILPPISQGYKRILYASWIIAGVFILGTVIFTLYFRSIGTNWEAGGPGKVLLVQFDLTRENVLATWFSSLILAMNGFLAIVIGLRAYGRLKGWQRLVWIGLGLGFLFLSADETGSIHERALFLRQLLPSDSAESEGPGILLYLIIGLVAVVGGLSLFSFWQRLRDDRLAPWLFLGGILFLGSIPFQEMYEMSQLHAAADPSVWQRPILFMILEEGAELAGMLCFLTALTRIRLQATALPASINKEVISRQLGFGIGVLILWAGLLVPFSIILLERLLNVGDSGILANWLIGAPEFGVSLLILAFVYAGKQKSQVDKFLKIVGILFLLLSIYHGANLRGWTTEVLIGSINLSDIVEGGFLLVSCWATLVAFRINKWTRPWIEPLVGSLLMLFTFFFLEGLSHGPEALISFTYCLSLFRYSRVLSGQRAESKDASELIMETA